MIQRIQTLHLLAVVVLTAVMLFVPLARYADGDRAVALHAFDLRTTTEAAAAETTSAEAAEAVVATASTEKLPVYLGILLVAAVVLPFATIFLYGRRLLQIRLCAVELVLLLGVLAMEAVYYFRFKALFANAATAVSYAAPQAAAFFPLPALFFVWLASRAIFRDEMLVRAADRIR